jgi:septal ring factor EnvC (AmiA/AmiB activator)
LELNMSIKKRPSASDVLRQEMQQPLVIPAAPTANNVPQPIPTPPTPTTMNQPTNDAAANEAKLKQQIEDLQSKLQAQTTKTDGLTKELKEAKDTVVKLAAQGSKAPAKSTAIAKTDATASRSTLTARPVQTSEETAIRRANTDIGWLD